MALKRFGNLIVDPNMVKVASVYEEFPSGPAPIIYHYPKSDESYKAALELAQSRNMELVQSIDTDIEIQKLERGVVVLLDNTRVEALADDVRLLLNYLSGGY